MGYRMEMFEDKGVWIYGFNEWGESISEFIISDGTNAVNSKLSYYGICGKPPKKYGFMEGFLK